jgi:hypothetical protein
MYGSGDGWMETWRSEVMGGVKGVGRPAGRVDPSRQGRPRCANHWHVALLSCETVLDAKERGATKERRPSLT